jgi:oligopeptide/dipeptide ABC transporter ATP-binding protein
VSVRAQILTLLKSLQDRLGVSYIIISHDLVTVAYLASSVVVMHRGRIVERGPTTAVYRQPRHPYTRELLASTPGVSGTFLALPDRPASVGSERPDTACLYAPDCALRQRLGSPERCVVEEPELTTVSPGHEAACHFHAHVPELAEQLEPEACG